MRFCSLEGCEKKHYARNFCQFHYQKINRETPEGREKHRTDTRHWAASARGKETMRNYQEGPGKEMHRQENEKYRNSKDGDIKRRLWGKNLSEDEKERAKKAFTEFNGKCYCCEKQKPEVKRWHLDHKGTKFRGILCHQCNCAAAFLRDSVEICKKMIAYLERCQCPQ